MFKKITIILILIPMSWILLGCGTSTSIPDLTLDELSAHRCYYLGGTNISGYLYNNSQKIYYDVIGTLTLKTIAGTRIKDYYTIIRTIEAGTKKEMEWWLYDIDYDNIGNYSWDNNIKYGSYSP